MNKQRILKQLNELISEIEEIKTVLIDPNQKELSDEQEEILLDNVSYHLTEMAHRRFGNCLDFSDVEDVADEIGLVRVWGTDFVYDMENCFFPSLKDLVIWMETHHQEIRFDDNEMEFWIDGHKRIFSQFYIPNSVWEKRDNQ